MVSSLDKAIGIIERTSAELGQGFYYGGMPTQWGFLWAANLEGEPAAVFELGPGQMLVAFTKDNLIAASKVAAGLNIIVQVSVKGNDGSAVPLVIVGPRGRIKKIFAFLGKPL